FSGGFSRITAEGLPMISAIGYGAAGPRAPLAPISFSRRDPGAQDVEIEILYCGECHSDLHQVRNDWDNTIYPCVPGHRISGRNIDAGVEGNKFTTRRV